MCHEKTWLQFKTFDQCCYADNRVDHARAGAYLGEGNFN